MINEITYFLLGLFLCALIFFRRNIKIIAFIVAIVFSVLCEILGIQSYTKYPAAGALIVIFFVFLEDFLDAF